MVFFINLFYHNLFVIHVNPACRCNMVDYSYITVLLNENIRSGCYFSDTTIYSVVLPIIPFYVRDTLNLPPNRIGFLFAAYAAGLIAFAPVKRIVSFCF